MQFENKCLWCGKIKLDPDFRTRLNIFLVNIRADFQARPSTTYSSSCFIRSFSTAHLDFDCHSVPKSSRLINEDRLIMRSISCSIFHVSPEHTFLLRTRLTFAIQDLIIRTMNASMNARPGALPPSPPASIARSSHGTSIYAVNNNNGPQKYTAQMVEGQLHEHYLVLKDYLEANLRDDKAYQPQNKARDKLLRLSSIQFQELSTDVYDELLRRKGERRMQHNQGPQVPRFLLPKTNFHPKRNQARQKLSTLAGKKFRELATDVLYELERRAPRLIGADLERVASPVRSITSSMRDPGARSPRSRPVTATSINTGPLSANDPMQYYSGEPLLTPYSSAVFENAGRDVPGPSSGTELARPLPKTFQSNSIVPNQSRMVEDDDDQSGDGGNSPSDFGMVGVTSTTSRATNKNLPYSVVCYSSARTSVHEADRGIA